LVLPLWAIALYGLFGEPLEAGRSPSASLTPWRGRAAWFMAAVAPRRWLQGALAVRLPLGLAIVALVAGPWYVAVTIQTGGDWLAGFLGTHNLGRFAGAMEGHDGRPFYAAYYLVTLLVGFFPASCFLPVALAGSAWRRTTQSPQAFSHAFALAVVAAWMSVFSVAATKLPNYVAPCYVGLAALTAAWLVGQVRRFETAGAIASQKSWLGAGLGSCAAAGLVITVALGVVSVVRMGGSPLMGLVGLAPLVGGAAGLAFVRAARPRQAVMAFVAASVVFTAVGVSIVGPAASPFNDGPRVADAVRSLEAARGGTLRVATVNYTTPSLVWELDRHVPAIDGGQALRLLMEGDAVVAMSQEKYNELRAALPEGVGMIADEGRFMRRHKRVVLVGDLTLSAQAGDSSTLR
jgi:4-amino-4-deoxy-L-arabinose transferase-like glycosyltransferase